MTRARPRRYTVCRVPRSAAEPAAATGPVVVVGGAVADHKMRARSPLLPRTSNPGEIGFSAGGVARNVAENLARLGHAVELIAPLGADAAGAGVLAACRSAGVGTDHVIATTFPTGQYFALLEPDGELHIAMSDMRATDELTVAQLAPATPILTAAALLMLDGNLPEPVYRWVVGHAAEHRVPVIVDPVSVAKARHLARTLDPEHPVFVLTPNLDELASILEHEVSDDPAAIAAAAGWFHDRGVANVWVRRGTRGSILSSAAGDGGAASRDVHVLPAPACAVRDVTGAGDSMTAGFIHAWLLGRDLVAAARAGQALASLTVEVAETVRHDLTPALVEQRLGASLPSGAPT